MAQFATQTDDIQVKAATVRTAVATIDSELTRLAADVKSLAETWTGDASNNFQDLYGDFDTRRISLQESLDSISTALTDVAGVYEETETRVAGALARK